MNLELRGEERSGLKCYNHIRIVSLDVCLLCNLSAQKCILDRYLQNEQVKAKVWMKSLRQGKEKMSRLYNVAAIDCVQISPQAPLQLLSCCG